MISRTDSLAVLTLMAMGLSGCGASATGAPAVTQGVVVDVQPRSAQVVPGGTVTFASTVTGTADTAVLWQVVEAAGGAVDATGLYTAPATTGLYHVKASSHADPSVQAVANVTVTSTPVVQVSISPSSASVQTGGTTTFTAIVTGTSDTAATWSVQEASGCGSVTQVGVYTAPASATTCHVVATSHADPAKSAVAAVTVTSPPEPSADCATAPVRATGTVYYYCDCQSGADPACVAGNDANAGTAVDAPRRTLANAVTRFNGMADGDTVALCRGGYWSGTIGIGKSCGTTATTMCDLRDYVPPWGSQATPRPIINIGGAGQGLAPNGNFGVRVWNLDLRSTNRCAGDGMIMLVGGEHDWDFCNLNMENGYLGFNVQLSNTARNNISVRQSQIHDFNYHAVFTDGSYQTWDSNVFRNNGTVAGGACKGGYEGGYYNHTFYLSYGVPPGDLGIVITNNEFVTDNRCTGVMLYLTGTTRDMIVENNYVHNVGGNSDCYGVSSSENARDSLNQNMLFRRNRIFMPNATSAAEISACLNCMVTDNIVQTASGRAFSSPERTGQTNTATSGTIFQNNTIYATGSGTAFYNAGEGSSFVFDNNAMFIQGSGTCIHSNFGSRTLRNTNNYCRNGSGDAVGAVFVDAANGNFKPVNPGPLIGTGNQTYYSPTAIGTTAWNPTDNGVARAPPVDIGAFLH